MVAGISLWKGNRKGKTFTYQDKMIKNFIERSGTIFATHRYIGPNTPNPSDPSISLPSDSNYTNELSIQDVTVLENRDRKYDSSIIDLAGCYTLQDPHFDLSQFGTFVSGDVVYIEFSLNDHVEKLGRKLMTGDVIEAIHMRDDLPLDQSADPIPKFYVVQECTRPVSGYGTTWFPHIWRAKCTPLADTQEFRDILHNPSKKIDTSVSWQDAFGVQTVTCAGVNDPSGNNPNAGAGSLSSFEKEVQIAKAITMAAAKEVKKRRFFIRHFYIRPANQVVKDGLISWVLNDDCTPPNWTGDFLPSGSVWPSSPSDGDYFIRTDYEPETLFLRHSGVWRIVQNDWRSEWVSANSLLDSYLRNCNISVVDPSDSGTFSEKQSLADVILQRAEYLPGVVKDGDATDKHKEETNK